MKEIIDRYFDIKKKKIMAGSVTLCVLVASGFSLYTLTKDNTSKLVLKKNSYMIEYGENIEMDVKKYLNTSDLDKEDVQDILKNTKITTNAEYSTIQEMDENGNLVTKEIGYPNCGKYRVTLKYKDETKTVKVVVKDTTAPEMTVPENIEILQGTDLSVFDFKSLITAIDLAPMNELNIEYNTVDINIPAEYTVKASIEDTNGNKTEKDVKVTVIAPPAIAEDEVVVQETVTNDDGTKTVKNTVKKKSEAQANGNKVVSNNTNNSSSSSNSGSKPSGSTSGNNDSSSDNTTNKPSDGGSSGGNSGNISGSGSAGGSTSGGNNGNTDGSGSTGGNTGDSTTPTPPSKVTIYWAKCEQCGKYVESTISISDARQKLKNAGCDNTERGNHCISTSWGSYQK